MRIILLLLTPFLMFACSAQDEQAITMVGTLGTDLRATISLTPHGKAIDGTFQYHDKQTLINLSGFLNGNILTLQEYNNPEFSDRITGTFVGLFSSDKYEGNWSDPDKKASVPFLFFRSEGQAPNAPPAPAKPAITYEVVKMSDEWLDQHFYGILNGEKTKLLGGIKDGECFFLDTLIDLNSDGLLEAIVAESPACGGNCCPDDYLVAFFSKKDQKFKLAGLGTSWLSPDFEVEKGKLIMSSYYESIGIDVDAMNGVSYKQFFDGEQLVETEFRKQHLIPAIWEITAEEIVQEEGDKTNFTYDLNGDGIREEIEISYWSRWAQLTPTIKISDSQVFELPQSKRFGVLPDRTNGYADLVIGYNEIFRWDGKKYVAEE